MFFRRHDRSLVRVLLQAGCVVLATQAGLWAAQTPQTSASAQAPEPAELPTGREVVDRFIEAIGGADAIASISSYRARGTASLTEQGITGTVEVVAARPARMVLKVSLDGIGEVSSGYDGKVAWSIDPISGPSILSGAALDQTRDGAVFDGVTHPPTVTSALEVVEITTFNSRQSYKVKVTSVSGREAFEYYDVETGLKNGAEGMQETPMGRVPSVSYLENYQLFGRLRQATVLTTRTLGFEEVVRITSFEYGVVDAAAFELPPAVKALVR